MDEFAEIIATLQNIQNAQSNFLFLSHSVQNQNHSTMALRCWLVRVNMINM